MGSDASIYSNVQAPQIQTPNLLDNAEKAMQLSQLGYQVAQQNAVRGAYQQNTDPQSGQLNREGFLSSLGKQAPQAALSYQEQFSKQDKEKAEAQIAQMQSAHQHLSLTVPALGYLLNKPDGEAASAFPNVMAQLKQQGVPMQNVPPAWDRGWAQQGYQIGSQTKEGLENQMIASNIATAPAKLNADLYGSRSPNAELTSQYNKQAEPIQKSQGAMQQMIDNYNNKTPQGDASLVLNAFKIKFPNAPDVNSLEELSKSEGASTQMKNWVSQKMNGLKDPGVRDNLMRDGISTFRANVDTLRGIQEKYQARGKYQNVNDPTLTMEPAIDKTYASSMDLQKQIGPYVPPNERGGVMGTLSKAAGAVMGLGSQNSQASTGPNPLPNGMIRMQGPDGKIRPIPIGMKGEAIAAGGSVVK